MSDYLEKKLLEHVLRSVPYASPDNVYLALFTTNPTDADVGNELSGYGYERVQISFGAASTPSGVIVNDDDIVFPVAEDDWGTVTHIGIYDAKTSGNLLLHGALKTQRTIDSDSQLIILAGELAVSFA